jgi:hypothetical protein
MRVRDGETNSTSVSPAAESERVFEGVGCESLEQMVPNVVWIALDLTHDVLHSPKAVVALPGK